MYDIYIYIFVYMYIHMIYAYIGIYFFQTYMHDIIWRTQAIRIYIYAFEMYIVCKYDPHIYV